MHHDTQTQSKKAKSNSATQSVEEKHQQGTPLLSSQPDHGNVRSLACLSQDLTIGINVNACEVQFNVLGKHDYE